MTYDVDRPLRNANSVNHAIENMIGGLRPHRSAAVPAPMPPRTRNISVTVPSAPASAELMEKLS